MWPYRRHSSRIFHRCCLRLRKNTIVCLDEFVTFKMNIRVLQHHVRRLIPRNRACLDQHFIGEPQGTAAQKHLQGKHLHKLHHAARFSFKIIGYETYNWLHILNVKTFLNNFINNESSVSVDPNSHSDIETIKRVQTRICTLLERYLSVFFSNGRKESPLQYVSCTTHTTIHHLEPFKWLYNPCAPAVRKSDILPTIVQKERVISKLSCVVCFRESKKREC